MEFSTPAGPILRCTARFRRAAVRTLRSAVTARPRRVACAARALVLAGAALAAGCADPVPDLVATLKGRFEGSWVVLDADRERLPQGGVPRERLSITIETRAPLGDALVPGSTYVRGTLAWGGRESPFELEYPLGSRGLTPAFVRYADRVAPFGPPDLRGFNLLLLTGAGRAEDRLCVDFQRSAPAAGGTEHMLRFVRAAAAE